MDNSRSELLQSQTHPQSRLTDSNNTRSTYQKALSALIEAHEPERPKTNSMTVPVSYCPIFLRVQAVHATLPGSGAFKPSPTSTTAGQAPSSSSSSSADQLYVSFLLLLQDPSHGLSHRTCSQSFPVSWCECQKQAAGHRQSAVDSGSVLLTHQFVPFLALLSVTIL